MTADSPELPLPPHFADRASAAQRAALERWWQRLSVTARRELTQLCEPAAESCEFALAGPLRQAHWTALPIRVGARFLPADAPEAVEPDEDWNIDFYEYLINNPELALHDNGRVFHICTAHPAVHEVLRAGVIPADFRCPLADAACPMRRLLARRPGHALQLLPPGLGEPDPARPASAV